MDHKPQLPDRVHPKIRLKHQSICADQTYVDWIKGVILFHDKRHPVSVWAQEVEAFLTHLAVERQVSAFTHSQALSALVFLYREILERDLGWLEDMERAKKRERLPVVLSRAEVGVVASRRQEHLRCSEQKLPHKYPRVFCDPH